MPSCYKCILKLELAYNTSVRNVLIANPGISA